jgi:hypothetical protein
LLVPSKRTRPKSRSTFRSMPCPAGGRDPSGLRKSRGRIPRPRRHPRRRCRPAAQKRATWLRHTLIGERPTENPAGQLGSRGGNAPRRLRVPVAAEEDPATKMSKRGGVPGPCQRGKFGAVQAMLIGRSVFRPSLCVTKTLVDIGDYQPIRHPCLEVLEHCRFASRH